MIDVLAHAFGRIAIWIDRDEDATESLLLRAQRVSHRAQFQQRCWADVGAMGVAKEHQQRAATEMACRDGFAKLIHEFEGHRFRSDRGLGRFGEARC